MRRPSSTLVPSDETTSTSEHALTSASSASPYSRSGKNTRWGVKGPVTNSGAPKSAMGSLGLALLAPRAKHKLETPQKLLLGAVAAADRGGRWTSGIC